MYHIYWFARGTEPKFHSCNRVHATRVHIDCMLKNAPLLEMYTFSEVRQQWFYDYIHAESKKICHHRCPPEAVPGVFRTLQLIGV